MQIVSVKDEKFKKYGQVLEGYDFSEICAVLEKSTPMPADSVIYVASDPALEALPVYAELRDRAFGGMPLQLGYCNGTNTRLNCVEYHRNSEVMITVYDTVLLLGFQGDITNRTYDTANIEAFLVPAGTGVEVYATSLHYAPCSAKPGKGFRVVISLIRGTNTDRPEITAASSEDRLLLARNKWLIAHPDAPEAAQGAHVGLIGENIDIQGDLG